jgi:hypothetical protein
MKNEGERMGQPGGLTELEREVLDALRDHIQTSAGERGGWYALVAQHVRTTRGSTADDDVEQEVIEALDSLERKGCVTKIGQTEDLARFPIYELTEAGHRALGV